MARILIDRPLTKAENKAIEAGTKGIVYEDRNCNRNHRKVWVSKRRSITCIL